MLNRSQRDITVGNGQFVVDGVRRNLYGGAVHYWRLDRDKWDGILQSVKEMGFNMISIYIPWEIHEIAPGEFDFSGNKDIDAFLALCEAKGFAIVVRPGPQINSELTWFGYPKRIMENPRLWARNAKGARTVLTQVPKPIPALNYAADEFFAETAVWYDAICPILARHCHPKGNLVAAQVDNEMAYFFCINAYAADFSEESIRNYRAFLLEKYSSLEGINKAHGTTAATLDEVDAPRRFSGTRAADIPRYVDWIQYREDYLINSMDRLADMMRARGLDNIALFHNYPHPLGPGGAASGFTTPFNIARLEEKLDFVGFDIYSRKELYAHVKTVGSYVVGTSRYPYIPEFIAGVWPWYLHPGELYDEEFVTKAALAQGIKGFSRYMLVERDRWLDSPIRRDGRVRADHAEMFGAANRLQREGRFGNLRRDASVLLLANREYDRLEAASVLVSFPGDFLETPSGFSEYANPMTISEHTLGFARAPQLEKSEWFGHFHAALNVSGVDFVLSDTDLNPLRWVAHKMVVLTTLDYLDARIQQALVDYAAGGGRVVIGPRVPRFDSLMGACTILADAIAAGNPGIVCVGAPEQVAGAIEQARSAARIRAVGKSDARLDVIVHADVQDERRQVVFVVNPSAEAIDAVVTLGTALSSARELWTGDTLMPQRDQLATTMKPYSIHVYECRTAGKE